MNLEVKVRDQVIAAPVIDLTKSQTPEKKEESPPKKGYWECVKCGRCFPTSTTPCGERAEFKEF